MVFSSLLFLFCYLPAVLLAYYLLPKAWRNRMLFFASLIFYAWGEPIYIFLMLFTIVFGYATGLMLERWGPPGEAGGGQADGGHASGGGVAPRGQAAAFRAKLILALAVAVNIGILGFFKYGGFIADNINSLLGLRLSLPDLPLPLGISFYTFQTMSYTIDVYRGKAPVQHSLISFGTYVAMFPQLIAGPIVRYNTVARQLNERRESLAAFGSGVGIFAVGLAKKVLLANNIGLFWDSIKAFTPAEMSLTAAWAGIVAFGLQLYFDFSGYSDMAVGLGRMLGFEFERNFDYPYISRSVSDFWRRWHISLSTWFKEYLYIPLGGSRCGLARTTFNLLVVWMATGIWHGANWNFLFWGLYYFVFLALEKSGLRRLLEKAPRAVGWFYTVSVVMVGWAIFVFEDMAGLTGYLLALAGQGIGGGVINDRILYLLSSFGVMLILALAAATPWPARLFNRLTEGRPRLTLWLKPVLVLAALLLSTAYLVDSSYNPFLYFRF
ncbi:MAG: MBOAT family O-acyltransferase [Peptococcaceae bacterium]|nr:MBOAT family O-acyltransferase [Peptococcaceae bacterium]